MKKIIIAICFVLCLSCQKKEKTIQEKCEFAISNYIKGVLNDPHSYEPESFTPVEIRKDFFVGNKLWENIILDSIKLSMLIISDSISLNNYKKELRAADNIVALKSFYEESISRVTESLTKKNLEIINKSKKIEATRDSLSASGKITYSTIHTYRAKNSFGALIKKTEYFNLDEIFNVYAQPE
jgi:hypothetical protein